MVNTRGGEVVGQLTSLGRVQKVFPEEIVSELSFDYGIT